MAFDYKKEQKELYIPKKTPNIINIPSMNYITVKGKGNPNDENGEYQNSIKLLYTIAYTIKMSHKTDHKIEGFFDFVVPPLEGMWLLGNDYEDKDKFQFVSMIRLPDFVTKQDINWAIEQATKKKKEDFSNIEFLTYDEGQCVQCMHIGSYDDEPITINAMHQFVKENGYQIDITDNRLHHEIYLSNPRRCATSKLKTVIRLPIKKDREI